VSRWAIFYRPSEIHWNATADPEGDKEQKSGLTLAPLPETVPGSCPLSRSSLSTVKNSLSWNP